MIAELAKTYPQTHYTIESLLNIQMQMIPAKNTIPPYPTTGYRNLTIFEKPS